MKHGWGATYLRRLAKWIWSMALKSRILQVCSGMASTLFSLEGSLDSFMWFLCQEEEIKLSSNDSNAESAESIHSINSYTVKVGWNIYSVALTHVYKGHRFVGQLQHGSGHVVHGGHLAVLHHLTDAVTCSRRGVNDGPGLNEVAAQAQGHQAGGQLHVQNTGLHLGGRTQNRVSLQRSYSALK